MAEKYTFSIEDSLLDALGFLKKTGTTVLDATVRPWRLVANTYKQNTYYNGADKNDASKNPGNIYVSHFLYFVMAALIFLSYYKAFIFNQYNGLKESSYDVIREANKYLANTSVVEKFLQYFPTILLVYFMVSGVTYLLSCSFYKSLQLAQKECTYLFRRMSYYIIGTGLFLQLLPVLFRNLLPPGGENLMGNILRFTYWGYCIIALGVIVNGVSFTFKILKNPLLYASILIVVFLTIGSDQLIFRNSFPFWLEKTGSLNYTPKLRIQGYENAIVSFKKLNINDSDIVLKSDILLINDWKDVIMKDKESVTISFIKHTDKGDRTTTVKFNIIQDSLQSGDNLQGDLALTANTVKKISIQSEPITKEILSIIEKVAQEGYITKCNWKTKYVLNYLPVNNYEQEVNHYLQVKLR